MNKYLTDTGFGEIVLGIPGIGVVTRASFFYEIGDPIGFDDSCQINKMPEYNLVGYSSSKNNGSTVILTFI